MTGRWYRVDVRRRLLIAAIFLLAGAVVNVAVAWGCAAWVPVDMATSSVKSEDFASLLKQVPPSEPGQPWIPIETIAPEIGRERPPDRLSTSYTGVGVYRESRWAWTAKERDRVARSSSKRGHAILVHSTRAGLPMPSLHGSYARASGMAWRDGALSLPWTKTLVGFVPLYPIWPGFAVNTVFYAAILWLLIPGPFALRRFIRVKRGLCPACAYPRGESDVCSECGKGTAEM